MVFDDRPDLMLKNSAMKGSNHQVELVQLIKKNPNKTTNQPKIFKWVCYLVFPFLVNTEELSQGTVHCTSNIPHKATKRQHIEWPIYLS